MIRLTFQRICSRNSPFLGDNEHLHHLMANLIKEKNIFIVHIIISVLPILIYSFIIKNFYVVFTFSTGLYFTIFFLLTKLKKNN